MPQSSILPRDQESEVSVQEIFLSVQGHLALVEQRIEDCLRSDAEILTRIASYLLELGGKRVRPVLTLLASRCFQLKSPSQEVIDVAAGIELIHMATLLHDDIIDESQIRRRQVSAYKEFGLTPSLLTGDFLLVKAFGLCARLDRFVVEATERACVELTEGEVLEGKLSAERSVSLEEYCTIVEKKTASLFALACCVGSHLAGAEKKHVEHLTEFGRLAGLAFQMVDDVLDVVADEDLLGKPAGADLRQKTPSLVNILWLDSGDNKAVEFFSKPEITELQAKSALKFLSLSEFVSQAREIASEYADRACQALDLIPDEMTDPQVRTQLRGLLTYTLERCY